MKNGISYTTLDNGVNYFMEGEGYPCIVVTEGEVVSNAMPESLKKHFKFIYVNAKMNIKNPGDVTKMSFDTFVEDVEEVRRKVGVEKVFVFGQSISGLIALEYARKYPEHTSHVIMNGTPPYMNADLIGISTAKWNEFASETRKEAWLKNWKGASRDSFVKSGTSEDGKQVYILDGPMIWHDYNFDATKLFKNTYWNMEVWNHIFSKLTVDYDISEGNLIEPPVYLALGKHDYLVHYSVWDDQLSKIPNLTYKIYENSSHWAFHEEDKLFEKDILEWMGSNHK
ncbi:alpha/beta hydrolase [Leptobacterium sp. I13]|uniref:alpha/beta hydrolase n=1 Tax=Leptobacterium meishanense TaxID=3128904 RepID=UPI0030EF0A63